MWLRHSGHQRSSAGHDEGSGDGAAVARAFSLHLSMRIRAFFLFACLVACVDLAAQQYPFVYYTPKNGLVNSRVRKMYQDSKGRIYFLTWGGLSVYDGARFRNYTTQNG